MFVIYVNKIASQGALYMLCHFQEINESELEFCDNLRGHSGKFLPTYRVFPPSPVELEFPRKRKPNTLAWRNKYTSDTYKIEPV